MKKIKMFLMLFLLLIIGTTIVYAGTSDSRIVKNRYDNIYGVYDGTDRVHLFYAQRYTMNGNTAYCIEPAVAINTEVYSSTEDWNISGLSNDIKRYVRLVAYYGYDYSGHQTMNYYLAAQELMWERITGRSTKWVTGADVNGPEVNVTVEKNEIERLIRQHTVTPSFDESTVELDVGVNKSINDTKGVLSGYQVYDTNLDDVSINGNTLNIKANNLNKDYNLTLIRKNYTTKIALLYYDGANQKLVSSGVTDPVLATLNIKVSGGKIKITKEDRETGNKAQGDATLNGAKYGLYNSNNELVDTLISSSNETSKDLPFGNYTLKELEPSAGYELDKNTYNITLSKDSIDDSLTLNQKVLEDVIKREYRFFKLYANDNKTEFMTGEPNIKFDIYLKSSNKKYTSITTDENGYASAVLVYGTYIVKQVTSTTDYQKIDDFEIVIDKSGEAINKVISNAEIRAKLKVIKIDKDTGEVINRSNIKFKIFSLDKNDYVCQTMTYPKAKTVCEYETDDNGVLITPNELNSGTYKLEEVDQKIDGYAWNKESVEFHIGENSELITDNEYGILFEVKFENKEVKGQIELTKYGEDFVIKDGTYSYVKNNLEGVVLGVYAREDIHNANGKLIYKKNKLITKITTDENGYGIAEDLYLGKYYIKEISTLDGYALSTKKYNFDLKYKDQYTEIVKTNLEIQNYLNKGELHFSKVDVSTSDPLPNTKIEIYTDKDELIFTGVTDENGQIVINDLLVGKYYILEKEAPEGYTLNDEKMYFEVKENGEIVKATMTDDKLIIEVPNTLKNDNTGLYVSIVSFGILGVLLIGAGIHYEKKKNKKTDKKQKKN